MASHIFTITPEPVPAFDGHDPHVFLQMMDEPVRNGLTWQHGPLSPAQARSVALELVRAAEYAEAMAARATA